MFGYFLSIYIKVIQAVCYYSEFQKIFTQVTSLAVTVYYSFVLPVRLPCYLSSSDICGYYP